MLNFKYNINTFIKKNLVIKKIIGKNYIFCSIRKKFLIFRKEEVIRQYIIFLLKKTKKYNNSNIHIEYFIKKNKYIFKTKKIDILVKKNGIPYIIIECKCTKIDKRSMYQISLYNHIIKSPYLIISNGIQNFMFKINNKIKKYHHINYIP